MAHERLAGIARLTTAIVATMAFGAAHAENDLSYVHCGNGGGDFRISELSHVVSQFSARYQEYRPLCSSCEIVQWDNLITMREGAHTFIQFNRLSGEVSITRGGGRVVPAATYRGVCSRGAMVVARTTRVF